MRRLTLLPGLLALLACAPKDAPPPPPTAAPKVGMAPAAPPPAPPEKPTAPAAPAPVAVPAPVAPVPAPQPAAPPAAKPRPRQEEAIAEVHLPAFTFRTMDHRAAKVVLNGEELNATPCLWSVTEKIDFDPKIRVDAWPPEGARFIGSTEHREHSDWRAELYIADAKTLPALKDGECLLYVDATIRGRGQRGALRLRVDDYHYVNYTPLVNPEGEEASRLLRTIWFERTKSE
jgi:hypothetical protein